jgi:hypothetical protein
MITTQNKTAFLILTILIVMAVLLFEVPWHLAPAKAVEKTVTLNVSNEPLSVVLNKISNSTGYRFVFDQKWSDTPVSATLNDLPIEKGLKRLLKNFDHAIVFESDRTIKIIIYGKTGSSAGSSAGMPYNLPPVERFEPTSETEQPPARKQPAPKKMPPKTESDDRQSADTGENAPENETDEENTEAGEEKPAEEQSGKTE